MPGALSEITNTIYNVRPSIKNEPMDVVMAMEVQEHDPQEVKEYAQDIHNKMYEEERFYCARPDYMDQQPDLNPKMRAILIDWLVEVHMKYKLQLVTLFLAVNIIDRFLERQQVKRKRLQLVGVTGMMIAAKFEEIYPPEVSEFVYITDKAYTKDEVHQTELQMLTVLEFRVCGPTVAHFFERYQRILNCNETQIYLIRYVLELALLDIKVLRYSPSFLVATACLLSNKLLKISPSWPAAMVYHTKLHEPAMRECITDLATILANSRQSQLQGVNTKFSLTKFHSVAQMTF